MNSTEKRKMILEKIMRWRTNLVWILVFFVGIYYFFCSALIIPWEYMLLAIRDRISEAFLYIMDIYTFTILPVIVLFLLTWFIRPDRYIWKSFLPRKKRAEAATDQSDILAEFYGRSHNRLGMFGWGLLIGFITNAIAVACALIHGDFKLYFEVSVQQIPMILFAFLSILIQSASEEMWCRGYLYERIHERYPLWVAVVVNGVLFGAMHCLNEGVTVISILEIAVWSCSYSLLRWYSGSIWTIIGVHAAWNITQNVIFGLPNSGFEAFISLFHLEASTGVSSVFYDHTFGVEGGLLSLLVDLMIGVVVLALAARSGRLKELKMNRAETMLS